MGAELATRLLRSIEDGTTAEILMPTELIVRESA